MQNKRSLVSLMTTLMLAGCATQVMIPTQTPPLPPPTPTPTVIPTNTKDIPSTQVAETQAATFLEPYQFNQSDDLTSLNRVLGEEVIKTLWFTQSANWWSSQDRETAQTILKLAMNPGLGVRALHAEGITGKGVIVAVLDQNLILDHPEFQGKIVKYHDVGTNQPADIGSMHGPAVTSLLAGENIGTAPGAKIYYVAVPSWLYDAQYYANALDWIIAENKKLPEGDKIRVVSASVAPSGLGTEFKNGAAWEAAYQRAIEAGILVLDCTYEHGYTIPCPYDLNDPDNVAKCIPEWAGPTDSPHRRIAIPMSHRTSAIERHDQPGFSYQYVGKGGLSWTVPYLSGVLAMGWQINPRLTGAQLLDTLYASAYLTENNVKVINPKAFIEMVKLTLKK